VRVCDVSVTTPSGEKQSLTVKAESLIDAASQGLSQWSRLSWWEKELTITVRNDGGSNRGGFWRGSFGRGILSGNANRRKNEVAAFANQVAVEIPVLIDGGWRLLIQSLV